MGVSKNRGTPKSSILIGLSIIFTIHFGGFTPIFLETPIFTYRKTHRFFRHSCTWTFQRPNASRKKGVIFHHPVMYVFIFIGSSTLYTHVIYIYIYTYLVYIHLVMVTVSLSPTKKLKLLNLLIGKILHSAIEHLKSIPGDADVVFKPIFCVEAQLEF